MIILQPAWSGIAVDV